MFLLLLQTGDDNHRDNAFDTLVQDINTILGPSSGIDSNDVDIEELKRVLSEYESDESEWSRYAFVDASRPYTRNLVDRGNGKEILDQANGPRGRILDRMINDHGEYQLPGRSDPDVCPAATGSHRCCASQGKARR